MENPQARPPRRSWGAWGTGALLLGASIVLLSLAFAPFGLWPAGLLALTPLTLCIIRRPLSWRWLLAYELAGCVYFLGNLHWLFPVSGLGTVALAAYLGLYVVLFAVGVKRIMGHLRWPGMLAVPLVWVTAEYLRTMVLTGFPWFLMGNSLSPVLPLIQVADLVGVWGVSFVVALTGGWAVDVLRLPLRSRGRFNPAIGNLTAGYGAIMLAVAGYGVFRLHQRTLTAGPRVAVVQKYIPQNVKDESPDDPALDRVVEQYKAAAPEERLRLRQEYERLSGPVAAAFYASQKQRIFDPYMALSAAVAGQQPDMMVWPETMVPGPLNRQWLESEPPDEVWERERQKLSLACDRELAAFAKTWQLHLLVGAEGKFEAPNAEGRLEDRNQNLAVQYGPDGRQLGVYAKRHLVPFGETVPFKESWPWLHKLLLRFGPYDGQEWGVEPGEEWYRFAFAGRDGRSYHFGVPICYEDMMPEPARGFVAPADGRKQADFLVSISNDGWYRSGAELDQHLQSDQIRAVENRVSFARAVNGGNSGFVDPDGRVIDLVRTDPKFGGDGCAVAALPLDSRISLYSRIGDVFPMACGVISALAVGWTVVRPRRGVFIGRADGDTPQ